MPSKSKAQAHFMSAIAHGWNPPMAHAPPLSVAGEFHSADKAKGVWEHATGGPIGMSPLDSVLGHSGMGGGFGNTLAVQHVGGNPNMSLGMAHMRMPRIPIEGTLRNIDQHIGGASAKLPKLASSVAGHGLPKPKLARGGPTPEEGHRALVELLQALSARR